MWTSIWTTPTHLRSFIVMDNLAISSREHEPILKISVLLGLEMNVNFSRNCQNLESQSSTPTMCQLIGIPLRCHHNWNLKNVGVNSLPNVNIIHVHGCLIHVRLESVSRISCELQHKQEVSTSNFDDLLSKHHPNGLHDGCDKCILFFTFPCWLRTAILSKLERQSFHCVWVQHQQFKKWKETEFEIHQLLQSKLLAWSRFCNCTAQPTWMNSCQIVTLKALVLRRALCHFKISITNMDVTNDLVCNDTELAHQMMTHPFNATIRLLIHSKTLLVKVNSTLIELLKFIKLLLALQALSLLTDPFYQIFPWWGGQFHQVTHHLNSHDIVNTNSKTQLHQTIVIMIFAHGVMQQLNKQEQGWQWPRSINQQLWLKRLCATWLLCETTRTCRTQQKDANTCTTL